MDTIFMNSQNTRNSNPYRLVLYQREEIDFKKIHTYVKLSNLVSAIHGKILKSYINTINPR